MAWPSGSKAGTTNVDAGADRPSLARPDIKQNIDNVNSIIDEFNISSPSNGDLLQYSTSTSKWEQVASSSIGGSSFAKIAMDTGRETVAGSTDRRTINIQFDPDSFITANGSYQMTLAAGSYMFMISNEIVDENEASIVVYNETADSTIDTFSKNEIGTTAESIYQNIVTVTLGTESDVSLRQTDASADNKNATAQFAIFKL